LLQTIATTTTAGGNLLEPSSPISRTDTEDLEAELRRAQHESAELRAENAHLRRENTQLRARFDAPGVGGRLAVQLQLPVPSATESVTSSSSDTEKIGLFRRLFRGREDVYAVRWDSSSSRAGYSPAGRSRSDRERGIFLPLTDQVLHSHLNGRRTIGVYPLLSDETCWFLAADFDKEHWQDDVAAYLAACDLLGVPAALERSRSGNGAHVWLFFEAPVPAFQARKLGCILLTLAIEQRHQIGLDSYDRLFPNQDTLPKGGFGNLIALPLQQAPRLRGNSTFIDRSLQPYPDQWAFLASVRRMGPAELDALVAAGIRAGSVIGVRPSIVDGGGAEDPWTLPPSGKQPEARIAGPFPPSVHITVANLVYVAKAGLPLAMISRLWRLAAFQNPEFYRAQALRLSTFGKPRVISCAEEFDRYIGLPRGCLEDVQELLTVHGVEPEIVDEHSHGTAIDVTFHGELTPVQRQAADGVLAHDTGVLCAPTAFGKTIVAVSLIAARQVNTLVLVHRRHLLDQWRERLATVLDLPLEAIGQVGGGRKKPTGRIDVAVIQSLVHNGTVDDLIAQYGHVIVDECHHIPAFTFERVLKAAKAGFVLGLTATPIRKDGHHPIVVMQCGPLRFRVSSKDEAAGRPFAQLVIPRPTGFRLPDGREEASIQELYTALAAAEERNELICADLLDVLQQGRTPLLLTERIDHLAELARRLEGQVRHLVVLQGGMGVRQRRAAMEQLNAIPDGEPWALLATGRYAGEGFDVAQLDTLLLTLPVSWRGTVEQYAGRLHRLHAGKHDVRVYDYVDNEVPMLARMYARRLQGYRAAGYVVMDGSDTVEKSKRRRRSDKLNSAAETVPNISEDYSWGLLGLPC
jgi:superfamily II DNA or RNA helicase